jgi:alkanesulfonate monooxygenase SsuD/methylene tetrahydromethanopterin reductase-like flavin-dependent oxidoreductase (luciferase family)
MQLNGFFPSLDIGSDPAKIRDWAQAAEDLGYAYIEVPDHVFGATARDAWVDARERGRKLKGGLATQSGPRLWLHSTRATRLDFRR